MWLETNAIPQEPSSDLQIDLYPDRLTYQGNSNLSERDDAHTKAQKVHKRQSSETNTSTRKTGGSFCASLW